MRVQIGMTSEVRTGRVRNMNSPGLHLENEDLSVGWRAADQTITVIATKQPAERLRLKRAGQMVQIFSTK